jgi:hypothetical protein
MLTDIKMSYLLKKTLVTSFMIGDSKDNPSG